MSELSKAYDPSSVEAKWFQYWMDHRCFFAEPARVSPKRPAYSIVIPPPNVTGVLHMGHVLNNTIQDILARKARMDGKEVLWLPGTDHAGIATEGMVEKQIRREEKKSKREIGREEFLQRVWAWKEKHGDIIIQQLKKLGCSCDWSRQRFTMDPEYMRCVQKVFVDLYKKGCIYRGKRMVNWCPATLTALSDEEVEMESQKGFLYYFRVEVVGGPRTPSHSATPSSPSGGEKAPFGPITDAEGRTWLTIATTRPETIPGDTAIAVNPKDPRYTRFIGQHVVRPLPAEYAQEKKLIPIIADEKVEFEFGTGVLKVTPAHDQADFDIGQRHGLPVIDVMNPNGTMNDLAGADLRGLDRFEARKVAVEKLKALGALVKEEPYENKIGISQRARVPIEPRLSEQWFLRYPSVEKSRFCVQQEETGATDQIGTADAPGKMRFYPPRWAKVYDHWMANIQDWCISRQLWWGHRIPVWSKRVTATEIQSLVPESVFASWNQWRSKPEEIEHHPDGSCRIRGVLDVSFIFEIHHKDGGPLEQTVFRFVPVEGDTFDFEIATTSNEDIRKFEEKGFTQDPDVLDTWCSSWLWPFATMGWPEQTETLKKFYPTTDLVTAPEIIFFWVARMIMAGYEFMGDLPFRNVYFTGIIRDKQGRKMSKSLGNSPDPLDLIAKYGADAVRFGTMRSAPLGQDVLFDEKDVELGRNFCNKLWNACRFRQMQGGEAQGEIDPNRLRSDDKWILLKLHLAIKEITAALAAYNFSEATQTLYRFFWSEYCDWYVESAKAVLTPPHPSPLPPVGRLGEGEARAEAMKANVLAVIDFVLSHTLRLFHPFLPFITEELWHAMGYHEDMPANQGGQTIMFAPWPKPFDADFRDNYSLDDCYMDFVNAKYDLVSKGRNLRSEANIPSNKKVKFVFKPADSIAPNDAEVLKVLLNAEPFEINPDYAQPKGTPAVLTSLGELYLPLEGLIDVSAETARLTKELEKIAAEIVKVEQKLNNPAFVQKVPPQVLEEHQKRLTDWQAMQNRVQKALEDLKAVT